MTFWTTGKQGRLGGRQPLPRTRERGTKFAWPLVLPSIFLLTASPRRSALDAGGLQIVRRAFNIRSLIHET
jgi:hypothetical protein